MELEEQIMNLPDIPDTKIEVVEKADAEIVLDRTKEVINLKNLLDDYNEARTITLNSISRTKEILDCLSLEISSMDEIDSEKVTAYSSLLNANNQTLKNLINMYKEISSVLVDIKNISKDGENKNNNVKVISSGEIIKRLKERTQNGQNGHQE